jgi:aryl-alcohol dehydrogenase-like predicted oxidoreductase
MPTIPLQGRHLETHPFLSADMYADSEILIGKWFALNPSKREQIFLATKFGFTPDRSVIRGDPAYVREALEKSLGRLGVENVDLYYAHR